MIKNSTALVVGISSYQNSSLTLGSNVANDARDIHALLTDPAYCAFSTEQVQLLLDQTATLQAIRDALATLVERCNKQTTVVIYFSGHGGQSENYEEGYLLPTDVSQDFAESAFSSTELSQTLDKITSRKVIVILDCCHAGGIGHLKNASSAPFFKAGLPQKDYDALASGYGRMIIASSRDSESSIAYPQEANSLFTKHFLTGLKGKAARNDGYVRALDLFHYLQPKVQQDSAGLQNPFLKAYVEENFPLAFNNGFKPQADSQINNQDDHYDFDVFISYLDSGRDVDWVMDQLEPLLEESGLKIADAHSAVMKGAVRISNMEVGFKRSRRILLVMSDAYLKDHESNFENVMFQDMGVYENSWRVIPLYWETVDQSLIPARLRMLSGANFTHSHPRRAAQEKQNLIENLKSIGG